MKASGESYLLMDEDSVTIARGELQNPDDEDNLQFRITQGLAEDVAEAEMIQAVPVDMQLPVYLGRVIFQRERLVVLEPLRKLGRDVRRNLRVPVSFTTYIYPESGGRAKVLSDNLSCSGIAFLSQRHLEKGDRCQIVIPITLDGPLLLTCEILRTGPDTGRGIFYAARFIDMINDEETVMRAAVFSVQIHSKAPGGGRGRAQDRDSAWPGSGTDAGDRPFISPPAGKEKQ